jgi:zinc transporter ZupT
MRPYFLHVDVDKVRKTFQRTTQFATNVMSGHRIIPSSHHSPAHNVWRRNEPVASDTIFSEVAAICTNGQMMAQILLVVLHLSLIFTECHLKNSSSTLLKMSFEKGRWTSSYRQRSRRNFKRVGEILRALCIDDWQSEPITNIKLCRTSLESLQKEHTMVHELAQHPANIWLLTGEWIRRDEPHRREVTAMETTTGSVNRTDCRH